MCFGGVGPSQQEQEHAAEQRVEADIAHREEAEKRAQQQRDDIRQTLHSSKQRQRIVYGP